MCDRNGDKRIARDGGELAIELVALLWCGIAGSCGPSVAMGMATIHVNRLVAMDESDHRHLQCRSAASVATK
jgi:hypothetical protein